MVGRTPLPFLLIEGVTRGILLADRVASSLPFYSRVKGAALDTLLGPNELGDDYVSPTTNN